MDILLSFISLLLRILAAYFLYKKYILPNKVKKTYSFYAAGFAILSLVLGFYVYVSTLVLLIGEGILLWRVKQSGNVKKADIILFCIILILFFLGAKGLSIDRFLL